MSNLDKLLRDSGTTAEMRRLQSRDKPYTYTYQGRSGRSHQVRRSDGKILTGSLATNGAITIGSRVRYANRQIDAMAYLPPRPQEPNKVASPLLGEVLVVFIAPDP